MIIDDMRKERDALRAQVRRKSKLDKNTKSTNDNAFPDEDRVQCSHCSWKCNFSCKVKKKSNDD